MNQNDPEREALKVEARRIVHDAIIHFDDSQRGYNSAADALDGKNEDCSLAFRCALVALQSAEQRVNAALDEAVRK